MWLDPDSHSESYSVSRAAELVIEHHGPQVLHLQGKGHNALLATHPSLTSTKLSQNQASLFLA